MIVHCEGCESGFHVDERLIKPTGSKLRCSKCRHVFTAYPPAPADKEEEPLVLGDALPAAETAPAPAAMPDIDSTLSEVFGQAAGEEPELLDVEDLLADAPPPKEALEAGGMGPDLDLDLAPAAAAGAGDTLPGLEELDLDLSMLEATAEKAEAAQGKGAPQTELELDLDLESLSLAGAETGVAAAASGKAPSPAVQGAAAVQAGGSPADLLDELNFNLEMADAQTTTLSKDAGVSAKSSDMDEIDISDLENMLDGQGPAAAAEGIDFDLGLEPEAVAPVEVPQTTDTLDLGLLEEDLTPAAAPDSAAQDEGLDLELDFEPETGSAKAETSAEAAAEPDELDFSDISGMLEQEAKPVAAAAGETLEEVDLVIEDTAAAAGSDGDLMLDLEALLDEGQGPSPAAKPDEASESFDLDFVTTEARGRSTDLEIELEPEAEAPPVKKLPAAAAVQAPVAAAVTDDFDTDDFTTAAATGATSILEPAPVAEPAATKKPVAAKARRSGSRKPLMAVLGVLVLAVAALVLPRSLGIHVPFLSDLQVPYLSEMDIEIPFIGNIFKSEPEDTAGRLKLALLPESITAEFIANSSAGMLCVVKGQVRNSFDHPRSGIQLTIKVYGAGNAVVKTATVFAGNLLSNQELSSLDLIAINARLKNNTGTNNMNVGVKPGRSVPFMAVFSNLPAGVDEYSVEVAGSTP